MAPAVDRWLANLIGKAPEGFEDAGEYWRNFSSTTTPELPSGLLLAGRDQHRNQLLSFLGGPPGTLTVRGETRGEAVAFVVATILEAETAAREAHLARCVVVADLDSWRWVTKTVNGLIVIPAFEGVGGVGSVGRVHHVIVPVGRDVAPLAGTVDLPSLDRRQVAEVLKTAGLDEAKARRIASDTRGRLTALRRSLSVEIGVSEPPWSTPSTGPSLAPLLLLGAWDESNTSDRQIVERLYEERSYGQLDSMFTEWAQRPDAPIRRTLSVWQVVSPRDAWPRLARFLTRDTLGAFAKIASDVLRTENPCFELPADERWMASARGKRHPYSGALVEGIAEAAALLGASPDAGHQACAQSIVRDTLKEAVWKQWATLSGVLPLLSEAAPAVFLDAVEAGLNGDPPNLLGVLQEEPGTLGAAYQTGLLWALETIAWNRAYLGRAAAALARLQELDPGGRWTNRPADSLRRIFLTWSPQTAASAEERFATIDAVTRQAPGVGWKLLIGIAPRLHDTTHPTARPKWRPWGTDADERRPTDAELWRATEEVVSRLQRLVGQHGARWDDLLQECHHLPRPAQASIVRQLEAAVAEGLSAEDALKVWLRLRQVLCVHRRLPDATWALEPDLVDRLASLYTALTPADLIQKYANLFSTRPELPEAAHLDWDAQESATRDAREQAARDIVTATDPSVVERLFTEVEVPYLMGYAIGRLELNGDEESRFLELALRGGDWREKAFAAGFLAGRVELLGSGWLVTTVTNRSASGGSAAQLARLLCGLPFEPETWNHARALGEEVERAYWTSAAGRARPDTNVQPAIDGLLSAGRPYAALEIIGERIDRKAGTVDPATVLKVLEKAAQCEPTAEACSDGLLGYRIEQIISTLKRIEGVTRAEVVRVEWLFLPVIDRGGRSTLTIHEELARNPELLVQLLGFVYKPEVSGENTEPDDTPAEAVADADRARARQAYRVLDSWATVPGVGSNGAVDPAELRAWLVRARELCAQKRHRRIGDVMIGQLLAHAPGAGPDRWPVESIADAIEETASPEIEEGLYVGILNRRGTFTKSHWEGGAQERALAATYRSQAEAAAFRWPRVSKVLKKVAEDYEESAAREDARLDLDDNV
jgi:hypothetical protein